MTGKIYLVGMGPGSREHMSTAAIHAIESADLVVGYKTYIEILAESFSLKSVVSSGMMKEAERCRETLRIATEGRTVALVSSGDSGIYGMAGLMLEIIDKEKSQVEVELIPGITAGTAAGAVLGAPIMHDYAAISLSDLLTDWELIRKRVECAAKGDFVICLYNPKSHTRKSHIEEARDIMMKYKSEDTPVGIVRNAMRKDESKIITDLKNMLEYEIDMLSTVIVGNSGTYVSNGKMITPRGYVI